MSQLSAKSKTPTIRFKGFSGEWVEKRLDEITIYIKGFAFKSADYRSSGTRIVRVSDLTTNDLVESNESSTYIDNSKENQYYNYRIKDGDIVITTVGSKAEMRDSAVGRAIIFNEDKGFLLNQNLVKLSAKEKNNSRFIHVQLLREKYAKFIEDIQRGNANQANIAINDLWGYLVYCPNPKEQIQIGNFFQQLDRLIAQHQQKHDKLRCVKKALLTKMFPKQGETQPAIRFKGFSEAWEEKALGDICEPLKGKELSWSSIRENGKYECILYGHLYTEYGMVINKVKYFTDIDSKKIPKSNYGDILIPASDTTPTGIARASSIDKVGVLLGGDINILRPRDGYHGSYLSYNINKNRAKLIKLIKGTSVKHLGNSDLVNIDIYVTNDTTEQTKIGNLFQQLDTLINQHQSQLTKLNNIKQAMLANMFV